jgi:group II intron reverse transcriptase/maturase/CRISPR-associated endonuclease Cas1
VTVDTAQDRQIQQVQGSLFKRVCDDATLFDAWRRVEGKGAQGGIDQVTIAEFRQHLHANLMQLSADLRSGRYVPEPFQKIYIPKFNVPGETRPLQMPTVRDKVAQEAVRAVIAPILEKTFVDCSYAYRFGKGPQKAIRRVEHYLRATKFWVAVADIDRFFDTMDQELTLEEIKKHIAAPDILRLLSLWMKMGAMDSRGHWVDPLSGIAQGSVRSPLLSNVYLTPFDAYLTHKGHALVRYADNFILLASSAEAVRQALDDATSFLEQRLKLRLNADPHPISSLERGFVFLGIYFHGQQRRIADAKIQQMQAEIRYFWQRYAHAPVPQLIEKLNESILGWKRYYGMVQPVEQFQALDGYIAEGLARALALRLARGELERNADLPSLLTDLAFLCDLSELWKKASLGRIVRRAKDLRVGKHDAPPAQTPSAPVQDQPAATATPEPTSTTPAPQATIAPSALRPVEQVVKQQKRRYLRRAVQGAELVISEPGVFLGKTSSRVVVKKQRRVIMEMPLRQLRYIIITTSGVTLSAAVITLCARDNIPLDFLSPRGEPLARLSAPVDALGTTGLRQLQAVHDGSGLQLARTFVYGKLKNQLNLVKYYHKYRKRVDADFTRTFADVERKFEALIAELRHFVPDGDYESGRHKLFAFEGQGGNLYWQMIRLLLEDDVEFDGRQRQGATDLVNSLLNYGYGMLYPRMHEALLLAGLRPGISFLHSFQDGKPTLTFDFIEEFRPQAVDRVVFGMITKGERLEIDSTTGHLTKETVRKLIQNILERLAVPIRYRSQEKSLQEIIQLQAKLLAAHLHGQGRYRPYIARW